MNDVGATTPACCGPRGRDVEMARGAFEAVPGSELVVETQAPIRFADRGSTDGMVCLEATSFRMGSEAADVWTKDGEGPVRDVEVGPVYLDAHAVTNRQFAYFVEATGYVTDAQRFGWSFVFQGHLATKYARRLAATRAVAGLEWWLAVPDARWDRPRGDRSNLKGLSDHPVVHATWNDAVAYCRWAGKRLPTEAEWECAARGGLEQAAYAWGDTLTPGRMHRCNIWQGKFPDQDTGDDGFRGTCPVDAFAPNGLGLYNCCGNVWEWTHDWFCPNYHVAACPETRCQPEGPPGGDRKVQKGGSFLCHRSYCNRYRVAARTGNTPDSSAANAGFRCARDV